ncbi:hypothetical protein ACFPVX_12890 [Cohnella faecalis]|uniref:Linear amide C-N hydrolase n=1 Tax=Cohnella faecalis TaxID=2315694 RepID=A0A398CPL3_9BACL|nr:hypothetical protein [Cohnella faecalis]RIE04465.1 hypothetical protein D3H35_07745 [Cohnella faecalis]
MCTTGAVVCRDDRGLPHVYGFKNSDSAPVGYWHGRTGGVEGFASLAYGLFPQLGVNAGMNEKGVALISSFFDYADPENEGADGSRYWSGDLRGKAQGEALAKARTASEALAVMNDVFERERELSIGGCHIIADPEGSLFVFEHSRGRVAVQDATNQRWVARSNQAFCLFREEQRTMSEDIAQDRNERLQSAEDTLRFLTERDIQPPDARKALRQLLSSHAYVDSQSHCDNGMAAADPVNRQGSICAHGIVRGRSNAAIPHVTMSGMIWELSAGTMSYTLGQPCRSAWRKLSFDE